MTQTISRFLRDESGATAIEYGLIASLVSVSVISTLNAIGGSLGGLYDLVMSILVGTATSI